MGLRDWFQRSPGKTTDELLAEARAAAEALELDEALAVYSHIRKRDRTPAILVEMARTCLALEDDAGALSYASDARDAAETNGFPRDIAAAMCVQGEVLLRERRRSDAEARFREAVEVDPQCERASAQLEKLRPAPSPVPEPNRGVGRFSSSDLFRGPEALARNQLAEIGNEAMRLHQEGRFEEALPRAHEAVQFGRLHLGEDHPDYATSLNNLAELYRSMGNYAAAEPLFQQAREISRLALGEDHPDYATSLNNLAALYQFMGNYDAAEPLYQQAREIRRVALGAYHPDYARSLNNLAALYKSMGNYDAAEPLYQQAHDISRVALSEDHPDYATSLNNLAGLYAAIERPAESFALMEQAAAIDDRMIGQVFSIGSERQRTAFLTQVRSSLDAVLSLLLRSFRLSPRELRTALDMVLRRKVIGAEAQALARDAVLGGNYPHLEPRLRELTTLTRQIAQKALAGPGAEGPTAHRQTLSEWDARKERLEADLARQIPEMNLERRLRGADRRAVALGLPEGIALVEFVRFHVFDFKAVRARYEEPWREWRYLAFVLVAGEPDQVRMVDLGDPGAIDGLIADFRAGLTGTEARGVTATGLTRTTTGSIPEAVLTAGRALRRAVFDRLVPDLDGRTRLLLAPDGDLTRLPFGVLPTDDGRLLIDDFVIGYLNSGRDVLRFGAETIGQPSRPLLAADPDFDFGGDGASVAGASETTGGRRSRDLDGSLDFPITRLEGTRREAEQIAGMLPMETWLGSDVREGRLKAECRSPCILHLATHGFFLEDEHRELREFLRRFGLSGGLTSAMDGLLGPLPENPLLRSGLVLAGVNTWHKTRQPVGDAEDGLLTALDVTGLDLLATELVVLSACDTGLGEVRTGEGVFGLQRAFILAGAKTLVMSLWKVPDDQTQELMVEFYQRLLAGKGRAEALREAQLAMKDKYPDPYYWGAFVCLGDPGPLTSVISSTSASVT
jgi:CHAT domain-containing protein/tetratricopeptide (TPR) repeat protein